MTTDTASLIETLERLEKEADAFPSDEVRLDVRDLHAILAALKENKRLRDALETYADERNWAGDVFKLERLEATCKCLGCWERYSDQGAVARAALQPQGEK